METAQILNNNSLTKTEKIRQLLALGLTRRQVADLTGGNYGFVQNVFARYWPEQVRSRGFLPVEAAFSFLPFNRKFGVEIEAYNVDRRELVDALRAAGINVEAEGYNHTTRAYWKIVNDGSVDGNNTFEVVSPVLQGQAGLDELQTVCRVLKRKNAYINRSCGLHIHFDAMYFSLAHAKNLLINYARYERIIDAFMPNSRRGNNNYYCKSLASQIAKVEAGTTIEQIANRINDRYFKVNLQSYLRYKTIEFRQHSGTIEFEKISTWVLFLHNLVEFSRTKRVDANSATFDSLHAFQQPEIMTYLNNRISELAA